jgi:hypothetical protein
VGADGGAPAVLADAPAAVMLPDGGALAGLALAALSVVLADGGAPAVLAAAPEAVVFADGGALAVFAFASLSVVLADGGAPEVLALAPLSFMLADGGAPTGPSPCTCSSLGGYGCLLRNVNGTFVGMSES